MFCPTCKNVNLAIADRQGIEIDYCPQCRGVWLDRGELDKIIERAAGVASAPPQTAPRYASHENPVHHQHSSPTPHYKKKKSSFLDDLFDF